MTPTQSTRLDTDKDIGTPRILQEAPEFQRVPSRDESFQQGVTNMRMTPLRPE